MSSSIPNRLVEVKCPTSGRYLSTNDLLQKLEYIGYSSDGKPCLKPCHIYYGQIQFSLYLGQMQEADLVIYCERDNDVIIIPVTLDPNFASEMLHILRLNYFTNILPYLYISRTHLRKQFENK